MKPAGFIRKTLLIAVCTWAYLNYVVGNPELLSNPGTAQKVRLAVLAIAAAGALTLWSNRVGSVEEADHNERSEDD